MRYFALLTALMAATSTYAMLPTPTNTNIVSYVATPTTNPNAPTINQAPSQIATVVNAFVVTTNPAGQEVLTPVNATTTVKSGDVLEYQGLFTNQGKDRVRKAEVTLEIADGLELIGGVSPQFAHASNDGHRFVRMPIRVKVAGQTQELPLSRYKALRWTVEDLGIGGTAVVKYRAKVK